MSANDFLDIFESDVPQTESGHSASESNAADQSLLEFENHESNIAGNNIVLQNAPGGSLLDFDVENVAHNSVSQSDFDVDQNVDSLMLSNTSANTDDVLGVFDTRESIQTKANNPIVDLSGGIPRLEAGACETTADSDLSSFGFPNSVLFQISDSVVVNDNNSLFGLDETENTAAIHTAFVVSDSNKLGGSIVMDKADSSSEDALVSIGQTVGDQLVVVKEIHAGSSLLLNDAGNVNVLLESGKAIVQATEEQGWSPLSETNAAENSGDMPNIFEQSGIISINTEENITLQSTIQNTPLEASISSLMQSESSSTPAQEYCGDSVLAATQPSISDGIESANPVMTVTSACDSLDVLLKLSEKSSIDQPRKDQSGLIDLTMCDGNHLDSEEPISLLPDGDGCQLLKQNDTSPTDKTMNVSFELITEIPQENQLLVVKDNGSAEKVEISSDRSIHQENAFNKDDQSLLPDLLSHDVYKSELLSNNPENNDNLMSEQESIVRPVHGITMEPITHNVELLQGNTLNGNPNKRDWEEKITSEHETGFELVGDNGAEPSKDTEQSVFDVETARSWHGVESFQPFKNPQANNGTKDYLVVHNEQSNDLLLQDDSSLNVSKKCDTIMEDTLESFNDITTSTDGVDSVGELAFQEGISKHTQYEGDHMIGLAGATTDVRSVMMSGSNDAEQLLVNQDGTVDLFKDENTVTEDTENKDSCASIGSDRSMLEPSDSTAICTEYMTFNDIKTTSMKDVGAFVLCRDTTITGEEDKRNTSDIPIHTEDDMCNSEDDMSDATYMSESKQGEESPNQIQDKEHKLPSQLISPGPATNAGLRCQVGNNSVDQISLSEIETDGNGLDTCINPVVEDESSVIEHVSSGPWELQIDSDNLMISPVLVFNDKSEKVTQQNISRNTLENEEKRTSALAMLSPGGTNYSDHESYLLADAELESGKKSAIKLHVPSSLLDEENKTVSFQNLEKTDENHSNLLPPDCEFIADSISSREVQPQKTKGTISSDSSTDSTDTISLETADNGNADAFENETSTSDLLGGSVATALIGRFVDDIICTAMSIVEEDLAAESMSDRDSDESIDHKQYSSDEAVNTNERYETSLTNEDLDEDEDEESPPVIPVRTKKRYNNNDATMLDSSDITNLIAAENEECQISESTPRNQQSDSIEAPPPAIPTRKKKKKTAGGADIIPGNGNDQACEIVDDSLWKTVITSFNTHEVGDDNTGELIGNNEIIKMSDDLTVEPMIESSNKSGECNPDLVTGIDDNLVELCEEQPQGNWQTSSEIIRNNFQDTHHTQLHSAKEASAVDPPHDLGLQIVSLSDKDIDISPADRQEIESTQGNENLLKIDEDITSFPKDEESSSFINNVAHDRNIGSIDGLSESSDQVIFGAEGHDIHDQPMNIPTGQESNGEILPIVGLTDVDGSTPSYGEYDRKTAVIISGENSDGVLDEVHSTQDEQYGNYVPSDYRGQYQLPPPLPEADYDELEVMHSQSADNLENEYTEDNEFSSVKLEGNTEAHASSSSVKKSISLPTGFYTNFSSVPSTVFIDKELFSDDGSDAESSNSSSSNDYSPIDGNDGSFTDEYDDSISQYKTLSKQYGIRQISNQEFNYPQLDPEPSTTYEAYDTDWEDIVTDPLRRYSDLPVILEESEPSEKDESETYYETYASENVDDITDESLAMPEDDLREESDNPVQFQPEPASEVDRQSSLKVNHELNADTKLEDVESESIPSGKPTVNQDVSMLDAHKVPNEWMQNEDGPVDPEVEDTADSTSDIDKSDDDTNRIDISSDSSTHLINQSIDTVQSLTGIHSETEKNLPTMSARESNISQGTLVSGFQTDTETFSEQYSVLNEDEIHDTAQNADGLMIGSFEFETSVVSGFDQAKEDIVLPVSDAVQLVDNTGKNIDESQKVSNDAQIELGGIEISEEQQKWLKKDDISQSPSADTINETASTLNPILVQTGLSFEDIKHDELDYLSDASVIEENDSPLNIITDYLEPMKMDGDTNLSSDDENEHKGTVSLQFDNRILSPVDTEIPSCNEITRAADVARTKFGAGNAQYHLNDDDFPAKSDDPRAGNIPNNDVTGEDMIASVDIVESNMESFTGKDVGMSLQQSTTAPESQSEVDITTAPSRMDFTLGTAVMHHREMDDLLTKSNDEEIFADHELASNSSGASVNSTQKTNVGPELALNLLEDSEASVSSNSSYEISLQNAQHDSLPIVALATTEISRDQQLALSMDKPSKQQDAVLLTEAACVSDSVEHKVAENVGNADHNKLQDLSTLSNDTEHAEIVAPLNTLDEDVVAVNKIEPINLSSEIEIAGDHIPQIIHAESDREVCIISNENSENEDFSPLVEQTEIVSPLNTLDEDVVAVKKIEPFNLSPEIENATDHHPPLTHAQSDSEVCIFSDENSENLDFSPQNETVMAAQGTKQISGNVDTAQHRNGQNSLTLNDLEPVVQDIPLQGITSHEVMTCDEVHSVLYLSSEIDQLDIIGSVETDNEVKVEKEPADVHVIQTTVPVSSNDTSLTLITSEVNSSFDSENVEENLPEAIESNRENVVETSSVPTVAGQITANDTNSEPQTAENLLVAAEDTTSSNSSIAFTSEKLTDESTVIKEGVLVTKSDVASQNESTTTEVQVKFLVDSQDTLIVDNAEKVKDMPGHQHTAEDQVIPLTETPLFDLESESADLQKNAFKVVSETSLYQHPHTDSDQDMDSNRATCEVMSQDSIQVQEPLTDGNVSDEALKDDKVASLVIEEKSDIKLSSEIPNIQEVDILPPPIVGAWQSELFPPAGSDVSHSGVLQNNELATSNDPMCAESVSPNSTNGDSDLTEKEASTPIIPSESGLGNSQPVISAVTILDTTQKQEIANEEIADIQSVANLPLECQEQTDASHQDGGLLMDSDRVKCIVDTPPLDMSDAEVLYNVPQTTNVSSACDKDVLQGNTSNDNTLLETTAILDEDLRFAQSNKDLLQNEGIPTFPAIHVDTNADVNTVHEQAENNLPKVSEEIISVEIIRSYDDKNVDSLPLEEFDAQQQRTLDGESGSVDMSASDIHGLQPNDTTQESLNRSEAYIESDIDLTRVPYENLAASNTESVHCNTSIPSTDHSKASSETVTLETHLVADTPPPPPLRKKKKAKKEATGELVDNPDQIDLSEATKKEDIPKLIQLTSDGKNSSDLVINNEHATSDEQREHNRESLISSIIDGSPETKRSADTRLDVSLTSVEVNLQAPNVTAPSIMLGVASSEESINTEDDKAPSSVEMTSGPDVTELVQPSEVTSVVKSTLQIEEDPLDIVREDNNVNPIVNKVDNESPRRLPPTIVISDEYGQQNELTSDSFSHAEQTGSDISPVDSASDGYSSSEKEYFLSDDDSVDNPDENVDPMHNYHLIADSLIASIMASLVSSVNAIQKTMPTYQYIDANIVGKSDNGPEDRIPTIEINGELLPPESLFDVTADVTGTEQDKDANETPVTTTIVNEDMPTTQQEQVNTSKCDELQSISQDEEYIKRGRQRFDTTGSIRYLTDSEDEDETGASRKSSQLISLDDDTFANDSADSTPTTSQDSDENNRLAAKRKSLVPPSSLVLSVALDEIDLTDKSDIQETPVSQRISLSSSLSSSQTSVASSVGEAAGNKRSMLPRLPSLRRKKTPQPVAPEIIRTRYQMVDAKDVIPIVPVPALRRVVKWETVTIKNIEYKIDEALVQPYKRVIAHGGFYDGKSTIIEVFMPYLPSTGVEHYDWIMDNIFLYVLATVELLAQGNFSVIIFAGSRSQQPANALLRRWHEHIDYRLKKNVEAFYIVNSTFYFRTVAKLFISRKVQKKMKYVKNMAELKTYIPTDFLFVPPEIAK